MGFGKDLGRDDMYADWNLRNCVYNRTAGRRHSGLDGTRYLQMRLNFSSISLLIVLFCPLMKLSHWVFNLKGSNIQSKV